MKKISPKAGEELVKRIFFMANFGPIYAWYVIAKTVIIYTPEPENTKQSKRLVYKKSEESFFIFLSRVVNGLNFFLQEFFIKI